MIELMLKFVDKLMDWMGNMRWPDVLAFVLFYFVTLIAAYNIGTVFGMHS